MGLLSETAKYYIHQSELGTFTNCGLQYEFRYIKGIKSRPAAALTVGSAVDKTVYTNLETKNETGSLLDPKMLKEVFDDNFKRLVKRDKEAHEEGTDWQGSTEKIEWNKGQACVSIHNQVLAPKIEAIYIQHEFKIDLPEKPYGIGGTIDHVENRKGKLVVCDTKTSKKMYTQTAIQESFQFPMYAEAFRLGEKKEASQVEYQVLIKPYSGETEATAQVVSGTVKENDINHLYKTMDSLAAARKAGVFVPANPSWWGCNAKWCGYWSICRGKKG